MINKNSLTALKKAQWTPQFKRPLYEQYAFSCLPNTIKKLLTGRGSQVLSVDTIGGTWEKYDFVILFLIDAFGWEFFEGYSHKYPFLKRFEQSGVASKISSEFPSTTAAHITSFNANKEVGQTGIYEWFYYEPLADKMIAPLLFSTAGDHDSGTLLKEGHKPEDFFPFETFHEQLVKSGVRSLVFQHESIAHSAYSRAMLRGAKIQPYAHFTNALDELVALCKKPAKDPTFAFVYFGDIDSMGHRHGIPSVQFADAVDYCWMSMENSFWQKLGSCPKKVAVLFTADHGMTPVHPKTTIYLNKLMPDLNSMIQKNRLGQLLIPAGSCRDFFLHIENEHLNEAKKNLQKHLNGVADVVLTEELMKEGFFGKKPVSKRLRDRIGNLLVLPYVNQSVFWAFEKHRFEQHFYAAHGGLTPDEMESIFLFCTP